MFLYAEGEIRSSIQAEPFKDNNGVEVIYYENRIETDDGGIELNSKDSYADVAKQRGVVKIRVKALFNEFGGIKGHKLTLASFVPGDELGGEEEVVS